MRSHCRALAATGMSSPRSSSRSASSSRRPSPSLGSMMRKRAPSCGAAESGRRLRRMLRLRTLIWGRQGRLTRKWSPYQRLSSTVFVCGEWPWLRSRTPPVRRLAGYLCCCLRLLLTVLSVTLARWGFHLLVLLVWGCVYVRRMWVDPRSRKCMGQRWGQGGKEIDWYEKNSVRDLLREILPGGARAPRSTPAPPNSKRDGSDTRLTSGTATGASTALSSLSSSPRGAGGGGSRTPSRV